MEVLQGVAKKENLVLPEAFAARVVDYAGRNLRRCVPGCVRGRMDGCVGERAGHGRLLQVMRYAAAPGTAPSMAEAKQFLRLPTCFGLPLRPSVSVAVDCWSWRQQASL